MLDEWSALLSVHQVLVTEGVLGLLLWSFVEWLNWCLVIALWRKLLCWVDSAKARWLKSSPVDEWLDFSVLSLYDLSHSLVEEVLSGKSASSAL